MLVVDVLNAQPPAKRRSEDRMARQIWRMEQEAIRFSLSQLGIPVVPWDDSVRSRAERSGSYPRRPL